MKILYYYLEYLYYILTLCNLYYCLNIMNVVQSKLKNSLVLIKREIDLNTCNYFPKQFITLHDCELRPWVFGVLPTLAGAYNLILKLINILTTAVSKQTYDPPTRLL